MGRSWALQPVRAEVASLLQDPVAMEAIRTLQDHGYSSADVAHQLTQAAEEATRYLTEQRGK